MSGRSSVSEALVPQKRARDDPSEQRCLRDDHRRRQQGECPTRSEVPTHGRHLPHEPRVERAHPYGDVPVPSGECAIASSGVAVSPVRRARNTQYVQAW